ncbi:transcriptional repressor [Cystobacter fuscus]|uniref:Ferric uptake regulation protein n=1 Tax=Cystobacter fuscus TaxID=43 RepID=A0A250JFA0_9BACT|nr:transcriptional repressor [Cystobacter fuscus]ATB42162.1 transcriptional repressor [Cystobacter fuscus]
MRRVNAPALDSGGLERALEQLRAVVHGKGLKSSGVRDAVARAALQYEGHFTAEELLTELRAQGAADTHAATVYRVLPLLVEAGLIQESLLSAGQGHRYERAFEREHHDHIICTSCKKVVEFEFEAFEVLQRDISEHLGFRLTGHVHELFGVCKNCQRAT